MRRSVAGLAIFFAAGLGGMAVAAADPGSGATISNVTSEPGQVAFTLSSEGSAQLDPKSVVVTVDGVAIPAKAVVTSGTPTTATAPERAVYLVLDTSGSMAGDGITAARDAAERYAATLPTDVQVGLVAFSDTARLVVSATANRAALEPALAKLQAGGNTALYDGVLAAVRAMAHLPKNTVKRLLILSDGADTTSTGSESSATQQLRAEGIAADVVAFRLPGNQQVLDDIARSSGGRVLPASDAGGLAAAFKAAAQAFRQQLRITVTVPRTLAGRTHSVTVTANAGGGSVQAVAAIAFPVAPHQSIASPASASAAPSASNTELWLVVGISFVALLAVALTALFLPVMAAARADKAARLAEMHRYRVLGVVGRDAVPQQPVARVDSGTTSPLTQRALSFVDRAIRARGKRESVVSELDRAGLRIRPEEWAVIQVLAVLVPAAVIAIFAGFVGFIVGGVAGLIAVRAFITRKQRKRTEEFNAQLPDTLQLLAGSLRTGFSLNQALGGVVREGTEPTASEFARALTEVRLGADLEDALDSVAERMRCEDLKWVVMALRISREVGGNLAEVLQTTTMTMRKRVELRGQVRVLTAEGRVSARVLIGLPFLILGYFALVNPSYVSPLFHTGVGIGMVIFGVVAIVLGSFWMSRLVKIKV